MLLINRLHGRSKGSSGAPVYGGRGSCRDDQREVPWTRCRWRETTRVCHTFEGEVVLLSGLLCPTSAEGSVWSLDRVSGLSFWVREDFGIPEL